MLLDGTVVRVERCLGLVRCRRGETDNHPWLPVTAYVAQPQQGGPIVWMKPEELKLAPSWAP